MFNCFKIIKISKYKFYKVLLNFNIIFFNHHKLIMVQRVTYRRRLSYNTSSNQVRKVRTPGSKVVVHYVGKQGKGPHAPHDSCDCGKRINGIAQLRPYHYKRLSKRQKTVSRPYGGVLCAGCVKSRIIRAFLLE
jgi:large subunit ribosomal protein L34e